MAEPTDPPAEETPAPAPAPAPAPEPAPAPAGQSLTLGQRLAAAGNAALGRGTSAELQSVRAELAAAQQETARLQTLSDNLTARLGSANGELAAARTELAEARAAVTDFEGRVRARSVEDCAAAGVPAAQLPAIGAGGGDGSGDRADALRKQLAATTDAKEKWRICAELSALRCGNN